MFQIRIFRQLQSLPPSSLKGSRHQSGSSLPLAHPRLALVEIIQKIQNVEHTEHTITSARNGILITERYPTKYTRSVKVQISS